MSCVKHRQPGSALGILWGSNSCGGKVNPTFPPTGISNLN